MSNRNLKEVPVYLFCGFLDGGKTRFIQETLEDRKFNAGERTLLLVCEEGEEEYDPSRFARKNVFETVLDDPADLTPEKLEQLRIDCDAERVIIEYNGMWMVQDLFMAMPDHWLVYQTLLIADATTFLVYNANMRNLTYDKLASADFVVFNRYNDSIDQMELHKLARAASRGVEIAYEYPGGNTIYDEIEDPLPFDLDAPIVKIEDRDYALFYQDIAEDMTVYDGKTLEFTGMVDRDDEMRKDTFAIGRHVMTCCVEDIRYMALAAKWDEAYQLKPKDWVHVIGKIELRFSRLYGRKGPVLNVEKIARTFEPEVPVASFY